MGGPAPRAIRPDTARMRPLLTSSALAAEGCTLRCWTEPGSLTAPMQDAVHYSVPRSGVLRVAAIDGCTPMRGTPRVAGVNGATYAVPDLLERVNAHLAALAPDGLAAARPSGASAGVEVTPRRGRLEVEAWAAGDAQVWVRGDAEQGGWRLAAGGSGCAPEVGARWAALRKAYQADGLAFDELQQREAVFFGDPSLFIHHTPLGRFPQLRLQHRRARGSEVVVATDGALLSADMLGALRGRRSAAEGLDDWVAEVRAVEARGVPRLKTTDDLAVVAIALTDPSDAAPPTPGFA